MSNTTVRQPERKKWPLAPAGLGHAVCLDVYSITTEKVDRTKFGGLAGELRDVTRLVWGFVSDAGKALSDEKGDLVLVSKKYTASLHEKASLRKDLQSWRGKTFTEEELQGFELESVLGANAQVQVIHNDFKGDTYANVQAIVPLSKGQTRIGLDLFSGKYTRQKDRKPAANGATGAQADEFVADDQDVPFGIVAFVPFVGLMLSRLLGA